MRSDWPVLLTLLLAVIAGICIQHAMQNQMDTISWGSGTVQVPVEWKVVAIEPDHFAAVDYRTGGAFGPQISLDRVSKTTLLPDGGELYHAANNWTLEQSKRNTSYRLLNLTPVSVNAW